jgi:hypothetical protein
VKTVVGGELLPLSMLGHVAVQVGVIEESANVEENKERARTDRVSRELEYSIFAAHFQVPASLPLYI